MPWHTAPFLARLRSRQLLPAALIVLAGLFLAVSFIPHQVAYGACQVTGYSWQPSSTGISCSQRFSYTNCNSFTPPDNSTCSSANVGAYQQCAQQDNDEGKCTSASVYTYTCNPVTTCTAPPPPAVQVSCSVLPGSPSTGDQVTWSATASGGVPSTAGMIPNGQTQCTGTLISTGADSVDANVYPTDWNDGSYTTTDLEVDLEASQDDPVDLPLPPGFAANPQNYCFEVHTANPLPNQGVVHYSWYSGNGYAANTRTQGAYGPTEYDTGTFSSSYGQPAYSYQWTGTDGLYGLTQSLNTTYGTPGTKSATVTANSPGSTAGTATCSVSVSGCTPQTYSYDWVPSSGPTCIGSTYSCVVGARPSVTARVSITPPAARARMSARRPPASTETIIITAPMRPLSTPAARPLRRAAPQRSRTSPPMQSPRVAP